jgi:hypothetical protein
MVKSLCIKGDVQLVTAAKIFSLCKGTTNLALWITPQDPVWEAGSSAI